MCICMCVSCVCMCVWAFDLTDTPSAAIFSFLRAEVELLVGFLGRHAADFLPRELPEPNRRLLSVTGGVETIHLLLRKGRHIDTLVPV